ncbi:uncharacterized protein ColSpa_05989 [Colletotrichum spaethianum]|uniref:Uncharacterized protein n=1 Tax=Colletotrichum spaethianum TaxID=700344 RepID=A0AA37LCD3_9PEZI|nr:uncharacterized protein ColSpa_05989 [Colletotrichum spaethianum]GKT45808.1 hypothetical protein ColSpa_05989 [Colletotrichum spaethianum]
MTSSSNGADGRRRNLPRGGNGKYKWTLQPHHAIQWQKNWLNLATRLFNIDEDDVLLTSSEKIEVLSLLAERITDSNIALYSLAVGSCKIVDTVRKICAGRAPFVEVNVFTALLRYSLNPPAAWLETEAVRQRWEALKYLERCANGIELYSAESLKKAMTKEVALAATHLQKDNTSAATMPSLVCTPFSNIPRAATQNRPVIAAARPRNRAVTSSITATPPSNKRKATSEPTPQDIPKPCKKIANPKKPATPKRAATSKNGVSKLVIKGGSTKYASPIQVRNENSSPTTSLRRAQRNRGPEAEHLGGRTDDVLLANIFKTTEVLNKVARYEDASVRQVALSTFIADLHKAGWGDLEKSAEQLIKDEDHSSRSFLASVIIGNAYERINDAVDKDCKSIKTDSVGPATGNHKTKILPTSCQQLK